MTPTWGRSAEQRSRGYRDGAAEAGVTARRRSGDHLVYRQINELERKEI